MAQARVVVTGLGAVSPVGIGVEAYWNGLKEGKNGIGLVTFFDVSNFPVRVAGEVKDFEPTRYLDE